MEISFDRRLGHINRGLGFHFIVENPYISTRDVSTGTTVLLCLCSAHIQFLSHERLYGVVWLISIKCVCNIVKVIFYQKECLIFMKVLFRFLSII